MNAQDSTTPTPTTILRWTRSDRPPESQYIPKCITSVTVSAKIHTVPMVVDRLTDRIGSEPFVFFLFGH